MAQNRQYTCFVISPLGGEESSERSRSDSVLNFLIIPVLTKCGFTKDCIIRSDKISETGKISEQIVGHIKNDDLCVIDMTDLNANVMYEYGLRMGYGKCYSNLNHTSAAYTTPPATGVLPLCTRLRRVRRNNPPWRSL